MAATILKYGRYTTQWSRLRSESEDLQLVFTNIKTRHIDEYLRIFVYSHEDSICGRHWYNPRVSLS